MNLNGLGTSIIKYMYISSLGSYKVNSGITGN